MVVLVVEDVVAVGLVVLVVVVVDVEVVVVLVLVVEDVVVVVVEDVGGGVGFDPGSWTHGTAPVAPLHCR
jgi:hypothetical protein